jgi:hypothetical protein
MGRFSKREQREKPQATELRENSTRREEPQVRGQAEESGPGATVDSETIARRAYDRYQSRGGEHGRDQEDWLEAEREVRDKQGE